MNTDEYSAYEPRPHWFTAVIIIWQGRMVILRLLAYRSSKTPDILCVLRDLYGVAIVLGHVRLVTCAWSQLGHVRIAQSL